MPTKLELEAAVAHLEADNKALRVQLAERMVAPGYRNSGRVVSLQAENERMERVIDSLENELANAEMGIANVMDERDEAIARARSLAYELAQAQARPTDHPDDRYMPEHVDEQVEAMVGPGFDPNEARREGGGV